MQQTHEERVVKPTDLPECRALITSSEKEVRGTLCWLVFLYLASDLKSQLMICHHISLASGSKYFKVTNRSGANAKFLLRSYFVVIKECLIARFTIAFLPVVKFGLL